METEISTDITISDLKVMIALIEATCQRGAWKANELATVGTLYNKITKCVEAINNEPEKQPGI